MKSALALALTVSLVASSTPITAQSIEQAGTLRDSISREAARFAGGQAGSSRQDPEDADWRRAGTLGPGTELIVSVRGSAPARYRFLRSDESAITVLNFTRLSLPTSVTSALGDAAALCADVFAGEGTERELVIGDGQVRVTREGIFQDGRKVAELSDVVERIARTDVVRIAIPSGSRGSVVGAGVGVGVGILAGLLLFGSLMETRCANSCGAVRTAMVGAVFGFPVLGGVIGYRSTGKKVGEVVVYNPR